MVSLPPTPACASSITSLLCPLSQLLFTMNVKALLAMLVREKPLQGASLRPPHTHPHECRHRTRTSVWVVVAVVSRRCEWLPLWLVSVFLGSSPPVAVSGAQAARSPPLRAPRGELIICTHYHHHGQRQLLWTAIFIWKRTVPKFIFNNTACKPTRCCSSVY